MKTIPATTVVAAPAHEVSADTELVTWLSRSEAAAYLRLSKGTLANWASGDIGPAYTRMGRGRVLYQLADIDAWLAAQERLCA